MMIEGGETALKFSFLLDVYYRRCSVAGTDSEETFVQC